MDRTSVAFGLKKIYFSKHFFNKTVIHSTTVEKGKVKRDFPCNT